MYDEETYEQMNVPRAYWDSFLDEDDCIGGLVNQTKDLVDYIDNFNKKRFGHGIVFCSSSPIIAAKMAIGAMFRLWDSDYSYQGKFPVYINYLKLPEILESHKKNPDRDDLWNRVVRSELLVIDNFERVEFQFEREERFLIQTVCNLIRTRSLDAKQTFLLTDMELFNPEVCEEYDLEDFVKKIRPYMKFLPLNSDEGEE